MPSMIYISCMLSVNLLSFDKICQTFTFHSLNNSCVTRLSNVSLFITSPTKTYNTINVCYFADHYYFVLLRAVFYESNWSLGCIEGKRGNKMLSLTQNMLLLPTMLIQMPVSIISIDLNLCRCFTTTKAVWFRG